MTSEVETEICGDLEISGCLTWLQRTIDRQTDIISDGTERIAELENTIPNGQVGSIGETPSCQEDDLNAPPAFCTSDADFAELNEDRDRLKVRIVSLQDKVSELETIVLRLTNMESEFERGKGRVGSLEAQRASLEAALFQQEKTIDGMRKKIGTHLDTIGRLNSEIETLRIIPAASALLSGFSCPPTIDARSFSRDTSLNVFVRGGDEKAKANALLAKVKILGLSVSLTHLPDIPNLGCPQPISDEIALLRWAEERATTQASIFQRQTAEAAKDLLIPSAACGALGETLTALETHAWLLADDGGAVLCELSSGNLDSRRSQGEFSAMVPIQLMGVN